MRFSCIPLTAAICVAVIAGCTQQESPTGTDKPEESGATTATLASAPAPGSALDLRSGADTGTAASDKGGVTSASLTPGVQEVMLAPSAVTVPEQKSSETTGAVLKTTDPAPAAPETTQSASAASTPDTAPPSEPTTLSDAGNSFSRIEQREVYQG